MRHWDLRIDGPMDVFNAPKLCWTLEIAFIKPLRSSKELMKLACARTVINRPSAPPDNPASPPKNAARMNDH